MQQKYEADIADNPNLISQAVYFIGQSLLTASSTLSSTHLQGTTPTPCPGVNLKITWSVGYIRGVMKSIRLSLWCKDFTSPHQSYERSCLCRYFCHIMCPVNWRFQIHCLWIDWLKICQTYSSHTHAVM